MLTRRCKCAARCAVMVTVSRLGSVDQSRRFFIRLAAALGPIAPEPSITHDAVEHERVQRVNPERSLFSSLLPRYKRALPAALGKRDWCC